MWAMGAEKVRNFLWGSYNWAHSPQLDVIVEPVLSTIESLKIGGCSQLSAAFIREKLGTAPKLRAIQMGGDWDRTGRIRKAFCTALTATHPTRSSRTHRNMMYFHSLKRLAYPAMDQNIGDTTTKENLEASETENIGEAELNEAAAMRGISASRAQDLEYKSDNILRKSAVARLNRTGRY
jgi:hypothetical protein